MSDDPAGNSLYWDNGFEIVLALIEAHGDVNVESVDIEQLRQWIIRLPQFADEPEMANEEILRDILREWYEETSFNE
jgi:FeS assembly protein IscX